MFKRQRTGSVVCSSCGSLVGVNDDRCYSCGRRNPGLWGFAPALRAFGNDLGFVTEGASSNAWIVDGDGILRTRGRWFAYRTEEGREIRALPTLHPAYLLRNLPDKAKAWADLVFARKTIASL
jgi:hypothetical protein